MACWPGAFCTGCGAGKSGNCCAEATWVAGAGLPDAALSGTLSGAGLSDDALAGVCGNGAAATVAIVLAGALAFENALGRGFAGAGFGTAGGSTVCGGSGEGLAIEGEAGGAEVAGAPGAAMADCWGTSVFGGASWRRSVTRAKPPVISTPATKAKTTFIVVEISLFSSIHCARKVEEIIKGDEAVPSLASLHPSIYFNASFAKSVSTWTWRGHFIREGRVQGDPRGPGGPPHNCAGTQPYPLCRTDVRPSM